MKFKVDRKVIEKVESLTHSQMLEVSHDLNCWQWNELLGDKPSDWDIIPCWEKKWYQELWLYKKLFNYKTKHDYVHPIRNFIG